MKNQSVFIASFVCLYALLCLPFQVYGFTNTICSKPDSAYLFAYATEKNDGRDGLHFAWSRDGSQWHTIGSEYSFIRCDYGRWGVEKRMISPYLIQDNSGKWHLLWSLNEYDGVVAHASSDDLVFWWRQSYPVIMEENNCLSPVAIYSPQKNNNCLSPVAIYSPQKNNYTVYWKSNKKGSESYYQSETKDFKNYSNPVTATSTTIKDNRKKVAINGKEQSGTVHQVTWSIIEGLIKGYEQAAYKEMLHSEKMVDDPARFAHLKEVDATISIHPENSLPISELLMGIFFEDISYAADGGLYAELIQNRGFEYDLSDKEGNDPSWTSRKAWSFTGNESNFSIDTVEPIHPNTKHYAVLEVNGTNESLINEGYDGIPVKAGDKYNFSVFAKMVSGKPGKLKVRLIDNQGNSLGEASTKTIASGWKKYECVITSKQTCADARLEVIPQLEGKIALDMISLFPQKTFKGHRNGLREDLAQVLADMKPRFVRFPGGCVAHGDGLDNMYNWKHTVGPLETRKPQKNIWFYHQSMGLGYHEYFQFCEDIGAEPVPVVPAGVPCQNSHTGGGGQQGGIPMCEMDEYIQDLFDLVEYANGDTHTKWGKMRAEAGHPKPFNLKYLGIGNEDQITDVFEERFTLIYNAFKEKHPEITVIGTVGPFYEGTDYTEGWELATRLKVPMVDEHYYSPPGWYIHNHDYYDKYDRSKSKVYLGEYAAHLPGRPNNIETALAEALHLISAERNGDIVEMTSYAPLLAKEGHINWTPDLIYFNNTEIKPTVGYYVQQLFGHHAGNEYIPGIIELSDNRDGVRKRIACSVVRDNQSNDLIIKMVNLLPVPVNTRFNPEEWNDRQEKVTKIVLQGTPDDKEAKPVTSTVTLQEVMNSPLPPYSFTVYRISGK